jgi:hypothetical protein
MAEIIAETRSVAASLNPGTTPDLKCRIRRADWVRRVNVLVHTLSIWTGTETAGVESITAGGVGIEAFAVDAEEGLV